jgi:hypothetical protein
MTGRKPRGPLLPLGDAQTDRGGLVQGAQESRFGRQVEPDERIIYARW